MDRQHADAIEQHRIASYMQNGSLCSMQSARCLWMVVSEMEDQASRLGYHLIKISKMYLAVRYIAMQRVGGAPLEHACALAADYLEMSPETIRRWTLAFRSPAYRVHSNGQQLKKSINTFPPC